MRDCERCFSRGAQNMIWMQKIVEYQDFKEQVVIKPEGQRVFQAGLLCEERYQVGKYFWKSCSFSSIEAWCTCDGMFRCCIVGT